MAELIVAHIRLPIFSIKHPEAFQVMSSLPIPQPSSLVGLLAYCVGVAKGLGTKTLDEVKTWVKEAKLLAARATLITGGLPMTQSSIVLRRFRVVDKAHESKEKGIPKPIQRLAKFCQQGDFRMVKILLEKELTDAFYREYVMGHELLCVWAIEDDIDLEPNWLYLTQRLGDTESLCTAVSVESIEAEIYETKEVKTGFPTPIEGLVWPLEGSHIIIKMCDELRNLRPYVVPCELRIEKMGRLVVPIVRPSEIRATYKKPVKVIKADDFILTAFWPTERTVRRRRVGH